MRGALSPLTLLTVRAGIIPADAGSTRKPVLVGNIYEDHPRGCGEH